MNLVLVCVEHSTPADGGRGGLVEVLNFENENEVFGDLDSLAVAETEVPVVVEDRVEVFNPNGVHWAVEHQPVVVQNVF